jgi:sugar lactone lactonase YvrE
MRLAVRAMRLPLLVLVAILPAAAQAMQVKTFEAADLVLGQMDFTTGTIPSSVDAAHLTNPTGVTVDAATGKVFVADTGSNRVLRFANASALRNGAAAERVFGQPDFSSHLAGLAAPDTLSSPSGVWCDAGGRLWVADTGHHRVVMYANAATVATDGPAADLVLGQPDSSTGAPDTKRNVMSSPVGICIDSSGRLWVAERGNNRVLRFDNAAARITGADADGVLGQQTFTASSAGSGNQQLSDPTGVAVDASGTLWVADRGNNRIFGYPAAATISNGTNAARVLGQSDFNTTTPGTTAGSLRGPWGVFADAAGNLWVLDGSNNRVLRFASISNIENGKPAAAVLGQPDFSSSSTGIDARHFTAPGMSLWVQPDRTVWVSDCGNSRMLRFLPTDSEPPVVAITGKSRLATRRPSLVLRGTASDDVGVTAVTVKVGKKRTQPAVGAGQWFYRVRLAPGRNPIRVLAYDALGNVSAPARAVIMRE